jgi:hypothetical protein
MKRLVLISLTLIAVLVIAFPVRGAVSGLMASEQPTEVQQAPPIASMSELLNYPYPAMIQPLEGPERDEVLNMLMDRPETADLMMEMADKGFLFDPIDAEVMRVTIETDSEPVIVDAMTIPSVVEDVPNNVLLSGALTAMLPQDGTEGFFQAHHTNLVPNLADLPDPALYVNGMPYFYIRSLRWINGQIIVWNYWWFDSHHHPNWYYSHYFWYWRYSYWYGWHWPYWYWWAHGWYYWRYWYFWSTWFPY